MDKSFRKKSFSRRCNVFADGGTPWAHTKRCVVGGDGDGGGVAQSAQLQLVMAILGPNKPYNNVESHAKHYFALVSPAICAYSMENHLLLHFYVKLVVPACQHFTVDALELLYYQAIATMAAACIGKGQKGRPSDTFLWLSGL